MSIKECLEAFVAHVQSLKEEDEAGEDGYTKEFQMLKQQSNIYRMEGTFSTKEGEREYNRRKNRYKDILPFDYTRVVLPTIPGLLGSDYINANFIKGATGENAYIASQGPLSHTVADFWRLIWIYKVNVVIMTANEYEGGKNKCAGYWPKTPEERQYGDVSVKLIEEKERGSKDFIVRKLSAKKGQETRIIHQLHYIAWPDHAVPASVKPLLEMVALARELQPEDLPPLLIHCSAGCGRTGTLCAIDYAWTLLKMGQITADLSLYDMIYEMRRQRPSSVQALDQYILVHHAVAQLFKSHLALINQHYNLPDHGTLTADPPPRTEEAQYENIPSSAFMDTSLDLPEVSVSAPASLSEDHYANISSAQVDVVQKAIRDTVAHLIRAASTSGLFLVPSGQKPSEPLRYAPSPRIRARRNEVENGFAHIQLKHPLPIPRKSRMERNSSSSSSRSSTSSISGSQAEPPREPIKSEPDYAVLSQFKSGDVLMGPAGTPIILQADGGEFMNTGTGPTNTQSSGGKRGEYENPCIVFTSPGAASHVYENTEPTTPVLVKEPTGDQCMVDSLEGDLQATRVDGGTMRPEQSTGMQEYAMAGGDPRVAPGSPHCPNQPDLPPLDTQVKMEVNPLYEDFNNSSGGGGSGATSFEGIVMEDNMLYEQSSASVRKKWSTHRGCSGGGGAGPLHSPGNYDIPPNTHIPSNALTMDGNNTHPRVPPKSPMISTDGIANFGTIACSRSPEAEGRRKPLPLPKPKTSSLSSPSSPERTVPLPHQQQQQAGDTYALPEKKTPTSSSSASPGPLPAGTYAYADPNALGKWSLQHMARGVPYGAGLEDGDYAQLKNPRRQAAVSPSSSSGTGQPAVPIRSTSAGPQYEEVSDVGGAYGFAGNGQRDSLSDDDSPQVPPKSQDLYSTACEPGDDDSITGQMSRSLDTLSESVTTFGRKLKQRVQQTFGKTTPGSPPDGLIPGTSGSDPANKSRGMAILYKGMDISFPHRVPPPRGPRSQTSPDGSSRAQHARH